MKAGRPETEKAVGFYFHIPNKFKWIKRVESMSDVEPALKSIEYIITLHLSGVAYTEAEKKDFEKQFEKNMRAAAAEVSPQFRIPADWKMTYTFKYVGAASKKIEA